MTENFKVEGFVEQRKELDKLMMSNPQMEKKVQKLIRKVLMEVRKHMGDAAKASMKSDPRQAYKAVKTAVYRQILGGSVSILNKRKAGTKFSAYEPPRKLKAGQRGGNRLLTDTLYISKCDTVKVKDVVVKEVAKPMGWCAKTFMIVGILASLILIVIIVWKIKTYLG